MSDYDLVVIGAGAAGLAAARSAARAARTVPLVERERPGGECTFYGCHVADEQERLAAANAFTGPVRGRVLPELAGGRRVWNESVVPWVTYTDPEVGRVGLTEDQAYESYAIGPGSRSCR